MAALFVQCLDEDLDRAIRCGIGAAVIPNDPA
jgi:hypothetical protein